MHDAIPSRILNGWLRLEEDLFHLQVLSYLPPQIPICRSLYTMVFARKRPTATSCSPSAPICSTVDANFLAMVPVAKIPHFITVPPGLFLWIRCVQYTMVFPCGKDSEKQKCPRRACSNSPGTILCTGIFHLVPNILIHYNRDRKKVPT